MTISTADVVVVGGGVVGTAIAAQLADAGQRVALVEASSLAAGASGAAPGRLNPPVKGPASGPVFDLHVVETGRYEDHISQLRSYTGIDPEYRVPGLLLPDLGEETAEIEDAEKTEQAEVGQDRCAALMAAGVDAQLVRRGGGHRPGAAHQPASAVGGLAPGCGHRQRWAADRRPG